MGCSLSSSEMGTIQDGAVNYYFPAPNPRLDQNFGFLGTIEPGVGCETGATYRPVVTYTGLDAVVTEATCQQVVFAEASQSILCDQIPNSAIVSGIMTIDLWRINGGTPFVAARGTFVFGPAPTFTTETSTSVSVAVITETPGATTTTTIPGDSVLTVTVKGDKYGYGGDKDNNYPDNNNGNYPNNGNNGNNGNYPKNGNNGGYKPTKVIVTTCTTTLTGYATHTVTPNPCAPNGDDKTYLVNEKGNRVKDHRNAPIAGILRRQGGNGFAPPDGFYTEEDPILTTTTTTTTTTSTTSTDDAVTTTTTATVTATDYISTTTVTVDGYGYEPTKAGSSDPAEYSENAIAAAAKDLLDTGKEILKRLAARDLIYNRAAPYKPATTPCTSVSTYWVTDDRRSIVTETAAYPPYAEYQC